jgi:hypothetical protein
MTYKGLLIDVVEALAAWRLRTHSSTDNKPVKAASTKRTFAIRCARSDRISCERLLCLRNVCANLNISLYRWPVE